MKNYKKKYNLTIIKIILKVTGSPKETQKHDNFSKKQEKYEIYKSF